MLKEFQIPFSLIHLFLHLNIQQATVRSPIGFWTTVLSNCGSLASTLLQLLTTKLSVTDDYDTPQMKVSNP